MKKRIISSIIALVMLFSLCSAALAVDVKYTVAEPDAQGIIYVTNEGGETLGYSADSGVTILESDGYAFKDLNKNGVLDTYEDWRLSDNERARALADLMVADGYEGIKAISGLMLYSSHTGVTSETISASTTTALTQENLRHVLVTTIGSPEIAAKWNNNVQKYAESVAYGIPANNSSDPRHAAGPSFSEYIIGADGSLSLWPQAIGLAATFDYDLVKNAAKIQSAEYRALGIATALSPMIDSGTDPRWSRYNGTFGEDEYLSTELARAFVDGWQTTYDAEGNPVEGGWGADSVNGMVKHWPGGGAGEGGRDAHYNYGKFAVYPGDNLQSSINVFVKGAFALEDGTVQAAAVMPYYTISYNQDPSGGNYGNSYSKYMITDLLRNTYGFDGVVCTDWNIVYDVSSPYSFGGMCWGVENIHITDRFIQLIANGVTQFGGVNAIENIMLAYDKAVIDSGKTYADELWAQGGTYLLTNILQVGLFENPYLDPAATSAEVGNADYMAVGYEAQQKSVVMLKNEDGIINADGIEGKVAFDWAGVAPSTNANRPSNDDTLQTVGKSYFGDNYVESIADADYVFVAIAAPTTSGYNSSEFNSGAGNGYIPISIQYGPYVAEEARVNSIAANPNVYWERYGYDVANRSYKDKAASTSSTEAILADYNRIIAEAEEAGAKVILYVSASNPLVFSEIEPAADAIFLGYSIQTSAVLDAVVGKFEPSGMLPGQQPASMAAVELQFEDTGHDTECYVDEAGNEYDFGFGLNYAGVIGVDSYDARYEKYVLSNDSTASALEGSVVYGKCGEGETAVIDVTYDGEITASTFRFQLKSDIEILDVVSDYDLEFNPENGKIVVWNTDGIVEGDVVCSITLNLDVAPWLAEGEYYLPIKVIEATNADDELFNVVGVPATVRVDNEYLLGDVNLDGIVSNADVVELSRYIVGLVDLCEQSLINADMNQDGKASNADVIKIARYICTQA